MLHTCWLITFAEAPGVGLAFSCIRKCIMYDVRYVNKYGSHPRTTELCWVALRAFLFLWICDAISLSPDDHPPVCVCVCVWYVCVWWTAVCKVCVQYTSSTVRCMVGNIWNNYGQDMYLLRDLFSVAVPPMAGAISGTGAVSTLIPSYRDMLEAEERYL